MFWKKVPHYILYCDLRPLLWMFIERVSGVMIVTCEENPREISVQAAALVHQLTK